MNALAVFFKKELALESRYAVPLLQSLFISPMVTALPLFFVYRSVFVNSQHQVAGWNGSNYLAQIGVGLICHFCLNSGSYVLFNRILAEWHHHTFALLWFSPLPRLANLLSLSLPDIFRSAFFAGGVTALLFWRQTSPAGLLGASFLFLLFFLFGAALGILRFFQHLLFPAALDFVNFFYLGLLFTSGLYFPVGVLPAPFNSLAASNPLFHGKVAILALLHGNSALASGILFLAPLTFIWCVVCLVSTFYGARINEACLKN